MKLLLTQHTNIGHGSQGERGRERDREEEVGGEGREGEGKGLVGTNNVNIDRKKAEIAQ